MQTHPKKRVEITIEAPLLRKLSERLAAAGVTGYTVLPVLGGSGRDGPWSADGLAGPAGQMAMLVLVTDAARVAAIADAVFEVVSRQIGIVAISDVEVLRPERF